MVILINIFENSEFIINDISSLLKKDYTSISWKLLVLIFNCKIDTKS